MALNLSKAGFDLVVYDSAPAAAAAFSGVENCTPATGPGDLAVCDAVITMLPTGAIVRDLLTRADGGAFLNGARPGLIVIDMSSSEPAGTRELAAQLAARGVALIDAPVSGGVVRATDGTLAIMAGTDDEAALEKVRPLLMAMGARVFETGGSGTGHAAKALNNVVAGTTFAVLAEALLAARRFGLDEATLIDVMEASTGQSFFTRHVMKQHVVSGEYATGFAIGLLAKDVKIAAGMARELGMAAPLMDLSLQRWEQARDALGYASDNSAAITVWAKS
jgi:3-hydroxyisobutyrate dehydrogenase